MAYAMRQSYFFCLFIIDRPFIVCFVIQKITMPKKPSNKLANKQTDPVEVLISL